MNCISEFTKKFQKNILEWVSLLYYLATPHQLTHRGWKIGWNSNQYRLKMSCCFGFSRANNTKCYIPFVTSQWILIGIYSNVWIICVEITNPSELWRVYVFYESVGTARFELATPWPPVKCATWLRHVPINLYIY